MTTSSDHSGHGGKPPDLNSPPRPRDAAWRELADSIPHEATEQLGVWIDAQLAVLEKQQERFVTNRTLVKSLRR